MKNYTHKEVLTIIGKDDPKAERTVVGKGGRLTYAPGVSASAVWTRNKLRAEQRKMMAIVKQRKGNP